MLKQEYMCDKKITTSLKGLLFFKNLLVILFQVLQPINLLKIKVKFLNLTNSTDNDIIIEICFRSVNNY